MQPFERATEEIRRRAENPKKALGLATAVAGSAIGSGLISRVIPFLNRTIPLDIMKKGLNKIDGRIGGFIDAAVKNGYDLNEVRDFLSSKFEAESNNGTQQNIIQKHGNPLQDFESNYPEIASALARTMQNGQSPDAAAAILKQSTPFSKSIKKLEQAEGKNFVDYILELFGPGNGTIQQPQQVKQENQQQQLQVTPEQGQPQGAGLDQQILAALDKILKM